MSSVLTQHPEYTTAAERWRLIRSIVNNTAKDYLRTPDKNDPDRTARYKDDALLTNFTNLTKVGLTGLVFRKKPKLKLPNELSYLMDDFTGSGINIWQFSQHAVGELLQMGRYGFLVDKNNGGNTYIRPYIAENITNWKTSDIGGRCVLSLVVLREYTLSDENLFNQDHVKQYRVLFLNKDGIYQQQVYKYRDEEKTLLNDGYVADEPITPLDYNGKVFNYIPFIFCGSENNDWQIDPQPLYDLAQINLAHYKCSADLMESAWICGQPYLVINVGEMAKEEFESANPGGVVYGSRKGLVLNGTGNATLLQANPNQMIGQVMKDLLEQASGVGARIIQPVGSSRETAEAAKIRYGAQHSALYTLTSNYSWAVTKAIQIAALFEGVKSNTINFELSDEFYDEIADANLIAQMILMSDRGIIAANDIREYGRRVGFINENRTDSEIEQEAEIVDPLEGSGTDSNAA